MVRRAFGMDARANARLAELVPARENRIRRCGASAPPAGLQSVKQALPTSTGLSQNFHNLL
jgi:hypothetical protein